MYMYTGVNVEKEKRKKLQMCKRMKASHKNKGISRCKY